MTHTQQALAACLAGTTFTIAGVTFELMPEPSSQGGLTATPMVRLDSGDLHPESDAVKLGELWHRTSDCVLTRDGTYALRDECEPIYCGWAHPNNAYADVRYYTAHQLEEAQDEGAVSYIESRGAYYLEDYCVYSESSGEMLHIDDAIGIDGEYYDRDSDHIRCDGNGTYFLEGDDDWVFVGYDYWPVDECHRCSDGDWVRGEEGECRDCNSGAGRINEYHNSPSPYLYRGSSGWLVGFEVEKTSVDGCDDEGDSVEELPLFSGWECDGSCGVEGITNVYDPLDPQTRALFAQHLRASRGYVNEPVNEKCGGHINLSHNLLNNGELFDRFRKYAGIYYALYKGRLNNEYCCGNKPLLYSSDKYVTVKRKPFGIELRLVAKVPNADVLSRRFDLVAATCKSIDGNVSFSEALRMHKDVILAAYSNDRVKVAKIMRLARHFHKWIHTNESHPTIERYIG